MKYKYSNEVKNNDDLRESFNQLTQQVFCFNFRKWYELGHWGDKYVPHVLIDGVQVISNISVNLMQFDVFGVTKNYIQLGTVMTDPAYRGQGLNREIMERILNEYAGKVDGIYLFGNDSVLDYYPKFGFKESKEYEYYMRVENQKNVDAYLMERVDMHNDEQCVRLYDAIKAIDKDTKHRNQNDAMCMINNLGLMQFWFAAEYEDQIYYLPELGVYVIANVNKEVLEICQIIGKELVDIKRLAKTFGEPIKEVVLKFTPVQKEQFLVREHKVEDSTLFIMGEDLHRIERDQMIFSELSHA